MTEVFKGQTGLLLYQSSIHTFLKGNDTAKIFFNVDRKSCDPRNYILKLGNFIILITIVYSTYYVHVLHIII